MPMKRHVYIHNFKKIPVYILHFIGLYTYMYMKFQKCFSLCLLKNSENNIEICSEISEEIELSALTSTLPVTRRKMSLTSSMSLEISKNALLLLVWPHVS